MYSNYLYKIRKQGYSDRYLATFEEHRMSSLNNPNRKF